MRSPFTFAKASYILAKATYGGGEGTIGVLGTDVVVMASVMKQIVEATSLCLCLLLMFQKVIWS